MWTELNEQDFQALLNRLKKDPKQPNQEADLQLLHLLFTYGFSGLGYRTNYEKITQLLNIFLDAGLPEDIANDPERLEAFIQQEPNQLSHQFPFFRAIKKQFNNYGCDPYNWLLQGYDDFDPQQFFRMRQFNHLLVPQNTLEDLLPHPKFYNLEKLRFEKAPKVQTMNGHMALMSRIIMKENPHLQGYQVLKKKSGKEPGFILMSPEGTKRYYVKFTSNMIQEYCFSQLLSAIGIKMPESYLLSDGFGNMFYATRDLNRSYDKGGKHKVKTFASIEDLVNAPQIAYDEEIIDKPNPPIPQQQKIVDDFLAKIFGAKGEISEDPAIVKTRQSYAKLKLAGCIFGLSDLCGHGGNIGLFTRDVDGKIIKKFGLCDFDIRLSDLTGKPLTKEIVGGGLSIFQEMSNRLTGEDIMKAANQLINPKIRGYSKEAASEGLLLVMGPQGARANAFGLLQNTAEKVKQELRHLIPDPQAFAWQAARIDEDTLVIIKNLQKVYVAMIRDCYRNDPRPAPSGL